jgi:perosamine synthetase
LAANALAPRGPVLDWPSFRRVPATATGSVEDLPNKLYLTSGRAAIYHALKLLALERGAAVLIPSYHCPTMVAPVVLAGLRAEFYGVRPDGLPALESLDAASARAGAAMIVPHYFGLPQPLAEVREWCDAQGVAMIEDCAHCYFGQAGSRPVGAWGDYATASLSKFFPVPEAGLLASRQRKVHGVGLTPAGWSAELKGIVDVFERSTMHQRFSGINAALRLLFMLKNARRRAPSTAQEPPRDEPREAALMRDCDMERIDREPLAVSRLLGALLPRGRVIAQRQRNFALYASLFAGFDDGARPLLAQASAPAAPYVFPLWVDDPNPVYDALRAVGAPVFRWDRLWPGVRAMAGDVGPLWSHHVLQLLCHQDLSEGDIERTVATIKGMLRCRP